MGILIVPLLGIMAVLYVIGLCVSKEPGKFAFNGMMILAAILFVAFVVWAVHSM